MHDRLGALVRGHEPVAHLDGESDRTLDTEGPRLLQLVGEAVALDILHEEVDEAGLDVLLVRREPHDVLGVFAEALHDLCLPQEAGSHLLGFPSREAIDAENLERLDPPALHILDLVDGPERPRTQALEHLPLVADEGPDEWVLFRRRLLERGVLLRQLGHVFSGEHDRRVGVSGRGGWGWGGARGGSGAGRRGWWGCSGPFLRLDREALGRRRASGLRRGRLAPLSRQSRHVGRVPRDRPLRGWFLVRLVGVRHAGPFSGGCSPDERTEVSEPRSNVTWHLPWIASGFPLVVWLHYVSQLQSA